MKKLFNKKGYTLTYVIVIIGLLLILTASVTFVSYYNFKTSRIGGQVNTSFYANDGALEEALTKFNQFTYNAEVEAWNHINDQNFLTESDWKIFLEDIYKDVNDEDLDGFTIEKANTIISYALKGEFEAVFFNRLIGGVDTSHVFYNPSGATLSDRYLDYSGYSGVNLPDSIDLETPIVDSLELEKFRPPNVVTADKNPEISLSDTELLAEDDGSGTLVDKGFTLSITSDGTYHKYNKKVKVDLIVKAPDYTFSVAMLVENDILYKNEIANKTLVANKNLVFVSGTSNVDGDIYAYGTFDDANTLNVPIDPDNPVPKTHIDIKYDKNRDLYGGIVVGYLDNNSVKREYGNTFVDGKLTADGVGVANIKGNVATRNSIKMESESSNLIVSESIFGNGLYIRSTADNSNITISEDMYLYNDLYVAADNININVGLSDTSTKTGGRPTYKPTNGVIWGLHDNNETAGSDYTRLGSIIISSSASSPTITANGMFLYGVIRYDVSGKETRNNTGDTVSYKTGESFTTFNNAQYYQTLLSDNIYQSGIFSFLGPFQNLAGTAFDLISFDALTDVDQVGYRSNHYYTMGYLANQDSENIYKKIDASDKSILKFRNVYEDESNTDNSFYGIAANGIVAFESIERTDGGILNKARVYNRIKTSINTIEENLRTTVLNNDVDERINVLGYPKKNSSDVFEEVQLYDNWLAKGTELNPLASIGLPSNQSTDITSASLGIYNNDAAKNVYINFPINYPGHINIRGRFPTNSVATTESLEGTIVSEGNIYINSAAGETFNFNGNIISDQNIYLMGNGIKNITYDETVIYETIHKTEGLEILYQTNVGRKMSKNVISTDSNFAVFVIDNTLEDPTDPEANKVTINYVSEMNSDGASIVDSNSITIDNWTETE